jgi:glycosyltransferase involved in cell wall biosynthesis
MTEHTPAQPIESFADRGSKASVYEQKERPLITFALFAYNQEKFIREAVEGAFSQTYSPLEIILSDDCSDDRTFEIIKEMVTAYDGPHKIVLNKNNENLGIGRHVCKLFGLSAGELIVFAAGDDSSLSERTYVLFEYWKKYDRPSALQSGYIYIDESGKAFRNEMTEKNSGITTPLLIAGHGKMLLTHVRDGKYSISGCAEACTRDVFKIFGDYPSNVISEDSVISFRALCLRGILYVPDILVRYRFHEGNICNAVMRSNLIKSVPEYREERVAFLARIKYLIMKSNFADMNTAISKGIIEECKYAELSEAINKRIIAFKSITDWWPSNYFERVYLFCKICINGQVSEKRWAVRRLLPYPLFIYIKRIRSKLKKSLLCISRL